MEPSLKVIKSLVESAGGRVENRRLKTTNQIRELNKVGSKHHFTKIIQNLFLYASFFKGLGV